MDLSDFPNYFQAAEIAAVKYQNYYKMIKRSAVVLLTLAVVITIYSFQIPEYAFWAYGTVGVLLLVCLVLTLLLNKGKYDQIWQKSLELKETCATMTWQFIMGVGEFTEDHQDHFIKRMQQIIDEFDELIPALDTAILAKELVTPKMIELREKSLQVKKAYYVEQRITPLQERYFQKAVTHHQKYKLWLINMMMSQILALVAIGFLMTNTSFNWSLVALITMLIAAVISWFEIHQNLVEKQNYTTSLKELDMLEQLPEKLALESELAEYVMASEGIISGIKASWMVQNLVKDERSILV